MSETKEVCLSLEKEKVPQSNNSIRFPHKIGSRAGLTVITGSIFLLIIGGIMMVIDYYSDDDRNEPIQEVNQTTSQVQTRKHLWRPHRAVLGVAIAGGVCTLLLTPIAGALEVAYYKCQYPAHTAQLSYLEGAKNSFHSAGTCLCTLICHF